MALALTLLQGIQPMSAGTIAVHNSESTPIAIEFEVFDVWVTAYSSTIEETDDTPFITASGKNVREGIIAANFLPFGTKVKIPGVFGDKILVVEDRMHPRKVGFVDVWMTSKTAAINFGINRATLIVLD